MNGTIFETWVNEQLCPALPPHSVVVMDNASYHSVQVEGSKPPVQATRKEEMKRWLQARGIQGEGVDEMKKPQLYDLVKKEKKGIPPTYRVDTMLEQRGHTVIRLPPYHCDMNPIELIWAELKAYVAKKNETFKAADVECLIAEGMGMIDQASWQKACEHVVGIEFAYWLQDNIPPAVNPVVIDLNNDDDDDDDESDVDSDD